VLYEPFPLSQAGLQYRLFKDARMPLQPRFARAEQRLVGVFSNLVAEEFMVEMTLVPHLWSSTSEY
jgi:hypothetical protein